MNINKYRDNFFGEKFYYPATTETVGAIQCKQGQHAGNWFVEFDENFEQRTDLQPTEGEDIYILLNIHETMFNDPIIIEDVQEESEG